MADQEERAGEVSNGAGDPRRAGADTAAGPGDDGASAGGIVSAGLDDLRTVIGIGPFRRLWICLGLSSLGDWLGLLALTAMAAQLGSGDGNALDAGGDTGSYMGANFAIAGVLLLRLLPALVFGPLGGYLADKLDRRLVLVAGDVVRFALFLSIPIIGTLWWLFVATVLIEIISLIWLPAKDATVPNLVPRDRLAAANQLFLVTTYGSALPAAILFTVLALVNKSLTSLLGVFATPVDLALYFNALTFLIGAAVIWTLREVSDSQTGREDGSDNLFRVLVDGWSFVARTPLVRGLVFGIIGAFAAGGVVIGLGRTYVADLQAGDAGYGVLFGAVFAGLAAGMAIGPRVLTGFSRRRLFGLALTCAGVALAAIALIQNIVIVTLWTLLLGLCAGVAWVLGYTMLGLEVEDNVRGRTFAFVHSMTRLALAAVLAAAPLVAGAIGRHRIPLPDGHALTYNGAAITILVAAAIAIVVGIVAYHQMDDRRGVSLLRDLVAAIRGHQRGTYTTTGLFIALEGGEGGGKSTQARRIVEWLRERGHEVVATREPGDTAVGAQLRTIVLNPETSQMSPRAEALVYAADRAEHVDRVIRPALDRGAVVLTDRYVDSSLAYQGAGRDLTGDDIRHLSRFATEGLRPHLVVVLDLDPELGLARVQGAPDRLEGESLEFHQKVREQFLELAALDPDRYLVVDAAQSPDQITTRIQDRLTTLLPPAPAHAPSPDLSEQRQETTTSADRTDTAAHTGPYHHGGEPGVVSDAGSGVPSELATGLDDEERVADTEGVGKADPADSADGGVGAEGVGTERADGTEGVGAGGETATDTNGGSAPIASGSTPDTSSQEVTGR